MEKDPVKKKTLKKKVGIGVLASFTAVSVLLGSVFEDPAEMLENSQPKALAAQYDDLDDEEIESGGKKDGNTFKDKVKRQIYKIPVKVRAILLVPLWGLGTLIMTGLNMLWSGLIAPAMEHLLNFALTFLILLLVIGITVKLLFPDMPWRKIFNKKTLIFVLIVSTVLTLIDIILPHFWEDYKTWKMLGKFLIGLIFLTLLIRPVLKRKIEDMNRIEIHYGI